MRNANFDDYLSREIDRHTRPASVFICAECGAWHDDERGNDVGEHPDFPEFVCGDINKECKE